MQKFAQSLCIVAALLLPVANPFAHASTSSETEIQHLLDFVAASSCVFIRNGSEYPASEARAHIERKYDYAKSRIHTTEEFIKYAATQSSFSGKPYQVVCAGEKSFSKDWLLNELERYRQNSSAPGKGHAS